MEKIIKLSGRLTEAVFTVREDNTLKVTVKGDKQNELVFHDFIRAGGKSFSLFHKKTDISVYDNRVELRTAAVEFNEGAPIKGLIVNYTFTFDTDKAAFYVSADYGCDSRLADLDVRLLDVSWENMKIEGYRGYETDACGAPFEKSFDIPEKNPDALDYTERVLTRNPTVYERTRTLPHGFGKAVSVFGEGRGFTVYGSTPVFEVEADFIATFPDIRDFSGDLRFFSGANRPGVWFIFEQQDDMFALFDELDLKTPQFPLRPAVYDGETYTVSAGDFSTDIIKTKGGVWTTAEGCQPMPLFTLDLYDTKYNRALKTDSGEGWSRVAVLSKKDYFRIILSDPDCGSVNGITVVVEAFISQKQNRISWKLQIINKSDRWSVSNASYPQCIVKGFNNLYITEGSGVVRSNFNKCYKTLGASHPVGVKTPMGFAAAYSDGKGVYMGVHDPECTMKYFHFAGAAQTDSTFMGVRVPAQYQHHAGNSFTLPGYLVMQSFSGDWFDATRIYREFVHNNATWFPKLRGRPDSPEWIRKMPVWIMHFLPNENPDANPVPITLKDTYPDKNIDDWYKIAIRFREEIGVPTAYHVYNWHWIPFNNDNPHYFPARPDFKEGVKALKDADIRIVPYVSGYSWDRHDCRGDDYRFENEAMPNSAKNIKGEVLVNAHASTEPSGIRVQFARMCPTTAFWKEEMHHLVKKLYNDYGVDGIYLDVVSASYNMCCDETHMHPLGFGSYWWRAYSELIAGLKEDISPEFAMTSESNSEVYASALDGYLSWTWVLADQVPGFPAVYGGWVANFGRVITPNKRTDDAYFRFHTAEAFMYGQQLGWVHPEIVDDDKQFPILKKLANLRFNFADFFTTAEMLRPPFVEGEMELLSTSPQLRRTFYNHHKTVVSAGWEDEEGNRKLFVANSSLKSADITITVSEQEYLLPDGIKLSVSDGAELIEQKSENGKRILHIKLDPIGVGVFEWKAEDLKCQ